MGHAAANGAVENFISNRMGRGGVPIPLKSTSYDIEIAAGLAVVKLVRTFRNDEQRPIEATLTFPVPFDAVVTRMEAKVGGRVLVGKAKGKAVARETYEDAIDRGKPAVLHEELLRGLHMLSVANVAPGAEIEVSATFVAPLALAAGAGQLRIPVTVGQLYGQLPLPDSDTILTGGPVEEAVVTVRSGEGTVLIGGHRIVDGRATVNLDRPIELRVVGERSSLSGSLIGRAADGRQVSLKFAPAPAGEAILDADLLLDVSGSMTSCVTVGSPITQWDAVKNGLAAAANRHLNASDHINVWVFSDACRKVESTSGVGLAQVALELPFDGGGTRLAAAVGTVAASRRNTNVLLVTDGQSGNTIDVQGAVATGARFTVVLVGEGALETNVGYLAALTGGQMFVAQEANTEGAIVAAIASMRYVASPAQPVEGGLSKVIRRAAGTEIYATWTDAVETSPAREGLAVAVGAYAASLAVLGMEEKDAARLAEAEGIVGHLTSLVLVDEVSEAVGEIPATRKVALADAATGRQFLMHSRSLPDFGARVPHAIDFCQSYEALNASDPGPKPARIRTPGSASFFAPTSDGRGGAAALRFITGVIAWDANAHDLLSGNIGQLDHACRSLLERISIFDEVLALAELLASRRSRLRSRWWRKSTEGLPARQPE